MVHTPEPVHAAGLALPTSIERSQAAIEEPQIFFEVTRTMVSESKARIAWPPEHRDTEWRKG